jgi:hypothetical protein
VSAGAILQRASDAGLALFVAKSGALGYQGDAAVFASMRAELLANKPEILAALIATAANEAQTLSPIQNQVKELAGHAWQRLAETMTPERWANIAELMASAEDGKRFLKDWTARNILALNIARGIVSPEQTRAVICRACGPVFTHRTWADDPAGQDGDEHGIDCVLSCEWCGRGVPNRRPELRGMPSCF